MTAGRRVLADTSAWIELFRTDGAPEVRQALGEALERDRVLLCDMVLLELWNGARAGREERLLTTLEQTLDRAATDDSVWAASRRLGRAARRSGATVPPTDLLIFATAHVHDLELLHLDRHFDLLRELVEDRSPAP